MLSSILNRSYQVLITAGLGWITYSNLYKMYNTPNEEMKIRSHIIDDLNDNSDNYCTTIYNGEELFSDSIK